MRWGEGAGISKLTEEVTEFRKFIEATPNDGLVAKATKPTFAWTLADLVGSRSYPRTLTELRVRGEAASGKKGEALAEVVARAEKHLREFRLGRVTSRRARQELKKGGCKGLAGLSLPNAPPLRWRPDPPKTCRRLTGRHRS